ncbi:hypothetical protein [Streptomyces sp. NPDC055912]|uniref:hypothetical protein n=1 Tax=Streptomyces sp. NPDC055912 TaxID=3345660 RepID=UPI0035E23F2C
MTEHLQAVRPAYVGRHRRPPEENPVRDCLCGTCDLRFRVACLPPSTGPRHARPEPVRPTPLPDRPAAEGEHQDLAEVLPFRRPGRR